MSTPQLLQNLLRPPILSDAELNRKANILFVLIRATFVGMVSILGFRLVTGQMNLAVPLLAGILILVLAFLLLRKGRVTSAAYILLVWLLGMVVSLALVFDGIHDTALFALPGILIMAGLLLKTREFYAFSAISFLSIIAIMGLELSGVIRTIYSPLLKTLDGFDITAIIAITVLGIRLLVDGMVKNLTLATAREQALRESEEGFRSVMENATDGMLIHAGTGAHLFANPAASLITGYSTQELYSMELKDIVHPDELSMVTERMKKRLAGDVVPNRYETVIINKKGVSVPIELTATAIRWHGQAADLVMFYDIAERKRGEEAIQEQNRYVETIMEHAPIGFAVNTIDDGVVRFVSSRFESIYGIPEGAARSFERFFAEVYRDPEYREEMRARVSADIASGDPSRLRWENVRIVTASGDLRYVTASNIPLPEQNLMVSTVQDVTDRVRAEEALRDLLNEQRIILDNANVGISMTVDRNQLWVNRRMAEMLQYGKEELVGRTTRILHASEEAFEKLGVESAPVLARGDSFEIDQQLVRKDGTLLAVRCVGKAVAPSDPSKGTIWIIEDISDRKRTEDDLRRSEAKFRAIVENSNDGILFVDRDAMIVYRSPSYNRINGYADQERIGRSGFEMVHPDDLEGLRKVWVQALQEPDVSRKAYHRLQHKNGEWRWLETSFQNLLDTPDVGHVVVTSRDITEQRQAEESLREAERRYRTLFEQAPDGVLLIDPDTTGHVDFNNKAHTQLGYSREEFARLHMYDYEVVEKLQETQNQMAKGLKAGHATFETRHRTKHGDIRDVLVTVQVLELNGRPMFNCIYRDITSAKKAETEITDAQERYRATIEQSNDGITIVTLEGRFVLVNEAFSVMAGYPRKELLRMSLMDLIPGDGQPQLFPQVALKGIPGSRELILVRKDGLRLEVSINASRLMVGENSYVLGIVRDVTERNNADRALRRQEEQLRRAQAIAHVGNWEYDVQSRMVSVSDEVLRIYGLNPGEKEIPWQELEEAVVERHRSAIEDSMTRAVQTGGIYDEEYEVTRKSDGQVRWVHVRGEPTLFANDVTVKVAGVIQDITDRKRTEEARMKLEQQLEQTQRLESIGTLSSGIAHDFNNILNIIIGNADLLLADLDEGDKEFPRINAIMKSADRGAQLVRQLLTFARQSPVDRRPLNANSVIREVAKLIGETFPKTIVLNVKLDPGLPDIEADANRIHQVLLNLCVNARDAMPNGGALSIESSLVERADIGRRLANGHSRPYVRIKVRDTGVGIDQLHLKEIFDPFFTTKEIGKGTGLGLSVVYGIVQSHGGFLEVESRPGEGSTFLVYMPATGKPGREAEQPAAGLREIVGGSETILFVDDEEYTRGIASEQLVKKGYRVLLASDGEEAVRRFRGHHDEIALVLCDFGLPLRNGEEVFKEMHGIVPAIRFILMTGFIEPEKDSDLRRAGVADIIHKPYQPAELLMKVREVLDRGKL